MSDYDNVDGSPTLSQYDLRRAGRTTAMGSITTKGLDLAKNVFQVHAVDAEGVAVIR
jgi:hypothetical protein